MGAGSSRIHETNRSQARADWHPIIKALPATKRVDRRVVKRRRWLDRAVPVIVVGGTGGAKRLSVGHDLDKLVRQLLPPRTRPCRADVAGIDVARLRHVLRLAEHRCPRNRLLGQGGDPIPDGSQFRDGIVRQILVSDDDRPEPGPAQRNRVGLGESARGERERGVARGLAVSSQLAEAAIVVGLLPTGIVEVREQRVTRVANGRQDGDIIFSNPADELFGGSEVLMADERLGQR